jgi:4-hydroxybenzoate decarboxylase
MGTAAPPLATLRDFVARLDATGRLLRVRKAVEPRFELAAVVRAVQRSSNLPVLFEQVKDTRFPVLSNVCGSYESIAQILGVEPGQVVRRWAALMAESTPRAAAAGAAPPPGGADDLDEISLFDLPLVTYCEKDAGPYLTAGVIAAKDPETGRVNLSYHRMQMVDPGELRCRLSPSGDLFRMHARAERQGLALEAAVLLGNSPALMLAAGTTVGPDESELALAERIAGHAFPLRACRTIDLAVPTAADIVIEGEILASVRKPEGPFGEWMDYYVPVTDNHVFRVRRVAARRDALFYAILSGSTEEITLTAIPTAGSIYRAVRTWVPTVTDVACWPLLQFCILQMRKQFEGQPRKAILAAFGAEMNRVLYCVAVDEDVNIRDLRDVVWAMSTRCRPDRDIFQIPGVPSFARDPHQVHWGRLGIDATAPSEWPAEFERKRIPGADTVRLEDYL